jgi:hypothetical protein
MRTLLYNLASMYHSYWVSALYSWQPMGNDDTRTSLAGRIQRTLYDLQRKWNEWSGTSKYWHQWSRGFACFHIWHHCWIMKIWRLLVIRSFARPAVAQLVVGFLLQRLGLSYRSLGARFMINGTALQLLQRSLTDHYCTSAPHSSVIRVQSGLVFQLSLGWLLSKEVKY